MREFQRFLLASTETAARGLEERVKYPYFVKNHQFHGFYCVTLAYILFSEEFLIRCRKKKREFKKEKGGKTFS